MSGAEENTSPITRNRSGNVVEIKKIIEEEVLNVASKDDIDSLKKLISDQMQTINKKNEKIKELEGTVSILQNTVSLLKSDITKNKIRAEANKQYSRRNSLRIVGIPKGDNESSQDCLKLVKDAFQEVGVSTHAHDADRVHRVGKLKSDQNGIKQQAIIVKLTSWKAKTTDFKSRPKHKSPIKFRFHADLTKGRFNSYNEARNLANEYNDLLCVFVDIDCRLAAKLKNNKFIFFDSIDGLVRHLDETND